MLKTLKQTLLLAAAAGTALMANAQTVTINTGTACTFTSYTQTVSSTGTSSFVFQAPNCSTGGGGSPSPGTIQFSSSSYPSIDTTTGSASISVTRSGATTGGGASSAVVQAGPAGTCSIASGSLSWADAVNSTQSVTVQAGATPGTCTLTLANLTNAGSPSTATMSVADSNAGGTVGFNSAAQTVTVGSAVTIPVSRSAAGTNGGSSSVSYTCNVGTSGSTVTSASPLTFAGNGTQNITLSAPTAANPITCTLSIASGTATLGTSSHTVTVNNVAAPVCQTPTANPASVASSTSAGSSTLTVTCSNSPSSYTWTRVNANAQTTTLASPSAASTSVSIPANPTTGTYTYQVTATNAGGTSSPVQVNVTVTAPLSANCVIRQRSVLYPSWVSGNAYNTSNAPSVAQPANETYAYEFAVSDLLEPANMPNALGMFQLYEAQQIPMTVSISSTPCQFSDTPPAGTCQRTVSTGSGGPRYQSNGHQPDYRSYGYCELPPPGSNGAGPVYYVNVRFAQPPTPASPNDSVVNPPSSTCQAGSCTYIPLYQRF